jgi:malonate decarboxylase beta subunit
MSKASAARITQRTIPELEEATKHVPAMAYDIDNYEKLGALYKLVKGIGSWEATDENVDKINSIIDEAIASLNGDRTLHFRYETPIAKASGRKATLKVRQLVAEQW